MEVGLSTKPDKTFVDGNLSWIDMKLIKILISRKKYIINSKQQSFTNLTINYDNLVSYNDVKDIFLSRKETFGMETSLDVNENFIYNVKDPVNVDQAINKKYVDNRLSQKVNISFFRTVANKVYYKAEKFYVDNSIRNINTKITDVVHDIFKTDKIKKYVDESHISSSTNLKDEFRHLTADFNKSSSESNVTVTGIIDLFSSPHAYNKKVYSLLLGKD